VPKAPQIQAEDRRFSTLAYKGKIFSSHSKTPELD